MKLSTLIKLSLLIAMFATSHGYELQEQELEAFIEDIIKTWELRSPTILVKDDMLKMCRTLQWLLCLSNDQDENELGNHLATIHQHRKQDSLIFLGSQGHERLLKHLSESVPSILTSNYPLFMPTSYQNEIKLRLDSNIFFYGNNYELYDIFAVKGGPPIKLEVGKWNNGMTLITSINRWDRRTNLQQTKFVNCLSDFPPNAQIIRDKNGGIIGSKGKYQDMLFYMTDKLNLSIEIVESPWDMKLLDNGSWTGEIGFLQRKEADVVSTNLGVNIQRSKFIDFPIQTAWDPMPLIAIIPKGVSPNMWVYVRVFGFNQWMVFIMFLLLIAVGLTVIHSLSDDQSGREFGTKRGSSKNYKLNSASAALSMVYLYNLQMGSHTNSNKLAPRLLTFTMSILTLLVFAFYTTDITAEMTSGPSEIPIRSFEDVIYYNYKVVTHSPYLKHILASSKPGSAMLQVYNTHFEKKKDKDETMKAMMQDSKTLSYGGGNWLIKRTPTETHQVSVLELDDSVHNIGGFAIQKDSEFLQIFNHYILKVLESGVYQRIEHNYLIYVNTREIFEMDEPQPLGFNNVMFCFISLGFGICISVIKVMMEVTTKKFSEKQAVAKTNERGGTTRLAKRSTIREVK